MSRDADVEQTLRQDVEGEEGLIEKPIFGGLAVLLRGHLLCGPRQGDLMVRLGKSQDDWRWHCPL